ncbi:MAG: hypothetical protein RLZZ234_512 [Candidatus Parcubacteria bacterium]|jgi:hypothetical protein
MKNKSKSFLSYLWEYHDGFVFMTSFYLLIGIIVIIKFLSGQTVFENKRMDADEIFVFYFLLIIILLYGLFTFISAYKNYKMSQGHIPEIYSKNEINEASTYRADTKLYLDVILSENQAKLTSFNKILPPESFFSTPRKIDWDMINETRKLHGELGEAFVYDLEKNYLTKIGRSDLAEKMHHVSKEGDGHGYDIKSFYENGTEKFIEVKATNASSGSVFNISKNEFKFLQTHLDNAVVYHVHGVNNDYETTVTIYPASSVVNSPDISPSGYVVKM